MTFALPMVAITFGWCVHNADKHIIIIAAINHTCTFSLATQKDELSTLDEMYDDVSVKHYFSFRCHLHRFYGEVQDSVLQIFFPHQTICGLLLRNLL